MNEPNSNRRTDRTQFYPSSDATNRGKHGPVRVRGTAGIVAGGNFSVQGSMHVAVNVNQLSGVQNPKETQCMFQVKDPIHTFTGREKFLEDLHSSIQEFKKQGATISVLSQTATITGLGGIGKTETVRMYIKQFSQEYDNVVWIDAEHPSEATKQFKSLADHELDIRLKDQDDKSREFSHILAEIYEKLCQKPKQLLIIFDNAEALENTNPVNAGIRQFLPPQTTTIEPPIILVTSRQQKWRDVNVITLGLWDTEECIEYIYDRLKLQDTPENRTDAIALAQLFDRLPIAIQVAVSVILEQSEEKRNVSEEDEDYTIQDLISDYTEGRNEIEEDGESITVQATIRKLLVVSLEKIKKHKQGHLAIRILAFMAYLSPTKIPKRIFHWLFQQTKEHKMLDSALVLLIRYSIIEGYKNYFTIHRVFQDVIIMNVNNLDIPEVPDKTPAFLVCKDEVTILQELTNAFLEHIANIDPTQDENSDLITNIIHTALYITQNSLTLEFYNYIETVADAIKSIQYETAIKLYISLLDCDINLKTLPPLPKLFDKLSIIALLFYENRKFQHALKSYNMLLQGTQIDNRDAFECNFVITQGQEEVLGALHPDTLDTKNCIALCLSSLGKNDEALMLHKHVLEARENVLGDLHPDTLATKHSVAFCLNLQGKKDEALKLHRVVLGAQEKELGALHPDTLKTKHCVAFCLSEQGKMDEALKLYHDVLAAREEQLGPLHPNTLNTKHCIAFCLSEQGKKDDALKLYNAVLEASNKVLGPSHPDTVRAKNNISSILEAQEKEVSLMCSFSELEEQEKELGSLHPDTLNTKNHIAFCLNDMGDKDEALKLYFAVLEAREKVLGVDHPDTLMTKYCIELCLND